jgi:hypothetical protein
MLSFTQAVSRVTDIIGASDSSTVLNAKSDINQALRLFQNAARRYWTRTEKVADLVAGQQYYQLPGDAVRVSEIKVVANGLVYPLKQISSEYQWNGMNVIPAITINVPTYYFVRGRNEIGLWPKPSVLVTNGLSIAYEPRMAEMSVDDVTGTATVSDTSTTVTGTGFTPQMVGRYFTVTDGTDGLWYKIASYTSATEIGLENYYQGIAGAGRPYIIGQCPEIPDDYHLALVYFAAYNYFLKRKDMQVATTYQALFNDLLHQYKETYSAKSTGIVIDPVTKSKLNLFMLPPNQIS